MDDIFVKIVGIMMVLISVSIIGIGIYLPVEEPYPLNLFFKLLFILIGVTFAVMGIALCKEG